MEAILTPPAGVDVKQTATADIWLGSDGIVRVMNHPGATIGAKEATEHLKTLTPEPGHKYPVLVDLRSIRAITREGRSCYRDPELNHHTAAVALLVDSALSKMIANVFLGLSKMHVPTRLFTRADLAHSWLQKFQKSG